ncbi:GNAT family N-acetyltransferase [Microbacterium sp. LTA6]|uniref:GNAT family N-acetyltransferase n=1 Tax=unclassified Microbacterium TaxID=2609290 RepID=UPI00313960FD
MSIMKTVPQSAAHEAAGAAKAAADDAGVDVRLLSTVGEFTEVADLFKRIWASDGSQLPVNVETLRALSKSGSYVGGAYDGDELVGACFGFFAAPGRRALHSHIAGVSARMRGRSVGFALKAHQRSWAIDNELDEISWTFDPLISRNAYFNLVKLSATPVAYHQNFYGQMSDALNGGDDTDRMLVTWYVRDPRVAAACRGEVATGEVPVGEDLLTVDDHLGPLRHETSAQLVRVSLPRDIEQLRNTDPDRATQWRLALRDTLGALLDQGASVVGFDRTGTYTLDRGEHQ